MAEPRINNSNFWTAPPVFKADMKQHVQRGQDVLCSLTNWSTFLLQQHHSHGRSSIDSRSTMIPQHLWSFFSANQPFYNNNDFYYQRFFWLQPKLKWLSDIFFNSIFAFLSLLWFNVFKTASEHVTTEREKNQKKKKPRVIPVHLYPCDLLW